MNRISSLKVFVLAMVLFALPIIRDTWLEPRFQNKGSTVTDLLIIHLSVATNIIGIFGLLILAGATPFITSLYVYTSSVGLPDSLSAYGMHTLPPGERLLRSASG